jgi:hypothetical protein
VTENGTDLRNEVARLRAEVDRQSALLRAFIQLFRAHMSNIAIFNQEQLRDRLMDQLDKLEQQVKGPGVPCSDR